MNGILAGFVGILIGVILGTLGLLPLINWIEYRQTYKDYIAAISGRKNRPSKK